MLRYPNYTAVSPSAGACLRGLVTCLLLVWATLLHAKSNTQQIRLASDALLGAWTLHAGSTIPPGNLGRLTLSNDNDPGLRLAYRFLTKVSHIGLRTTGEWPGPWVQLSFSVQARQPLDGVVLLRDAEGEVFQARWQTEAKQAQRVELAVDREAFSQNWGKAADGRIDYPLQSVTVGLSRQGPQRGVVTFRDITYQPAAMPALPQAALAVEANAPATLFLPQDSEPVLWMIAQNHMPQPLEAELRLRWENLQGQPGQAVRRLTLLTHENVRFSWPLALEMSEYRVYHVELWQGNDVLARARHAVAMLPEPGEALGFDETFFGICYMEEVWAARRMGVGFIRKLAHWKFIESYPSQYFTRPLDDLLRASAEAGLAVVVTAVVRESPAWASFEGPAGFFKGGNDLILSQYLQTLLERMRLHEVSGALEIQNEPDIALQWLNKMSLQPASQVAAAVVTVACLVGASAFYLVGVMLMDSWGTWLIERLSSPESFENLKQVLRDDGFILILAAGVSPIPFQIAMLAAGAVDYSFSLFLLSAALARGIRYFGLAWLVQRYGEGALRIWQENKLKAGMLALLVLAVLYGFGRLVESTLMG